MKGYIEPSFAEKNRRLVMDRTEGRNLNRNGGAEPRPIDGNLSSRTIFLSTTITRTVTSRVLCIPNGLFADAAAAASICRRKRDLNFELLEDKELLPTSLCDVRCETFPTVITDFKISKLNSFFP